MAKGKGSTRAKAPAKGKGTVDKTPAAPRSVQDTLRPATQAEILAEDPMRQVDRIPVLEPTANVPYTVVEPTDPEVKKRQDAAIEKAKKDGAALAKRRDEARDAEYKDREKRAVSVRAIRTGQYPANGRLRRPGEVFDYVPVKDPKTDKYEEKLPSWVEDVDGKVKSRPAGEPSASFDAAPAAIITVGKDGSVTSRAATDHERSKSSQVI